MGDGQDRKRHIKAPPRSLAREHREASQGYRAKVFWLTGPSGAGKSTIAHRVEQLLFDDGYFGLAVLDGDRMRGGLCSDLGFSPEARHENIRRVAHVGRLFLEHGILCLCAFISPYRADRANAADIVGAGDFREIYVSCPQAVCEERDCKGFYELARKGVIKNYTGVSAPYEEPEDPALVIRTDELAIEESAEALRRFICKETRIDSP
ncbi:MAG: adenylyl-sulfate kinase [Desulfovibrio sp.]|jgi:adenylylsulfate kinase|nr:adenylyl-sulfate kinase [Desulfovibrio sp.]